MLAEKAPLQSWSPPLDHPVETQEILYFRYHAYRRRQASQLLHVMPREAVRPLYAEARAWAKERGVYDRRDPMTALVRYAELILPLPTFDIWLADRAAHPLSHLEDAAEASHMASETRPGCVDRRSFSARGQTWVAGLHVFRRDDVWRGFISFRREGAVVGEQYYTANVFREEDPQEVAERFADFDEASLWAFLNSALP